jgi:hypothetical protein
MALPTDRSNLFRNWPAWSARRRTIRLANPVSEDPDAVDPSEIVFYTSENGDKWALVTDVGGRKFVRHTPSDRSGGEVSLTDLESFRERDPHSPQNERLEAAVVEGAPLDVPVKLAD